LCFGLALAANLSLIVWVSVIGVAPGAGWNSISAVTLTALWCFKAFSSALAPARLGVTVNVAVPSAATL
jgi:hypothetical protein